MLTIATGQESIGGQHAGDLRGAEVHPPPNLEARRVDLGGPVAGSAETDSQPFRRAIQYRCQLADAEQRAVLLQKRFFDGHSVLQPC
jgi:hypothetical protein